MARKIAVMGSAPSSVALAPFADPSWEIWGCSPGLYYQAKRIDVWFELHRWEPPIIGDPTRQRPWYSPEYVLWMAQLGKPVYMAQAVPEIPTSRPIPLQRLIARWGRFVFSSTISYMLAMAIDEILESRRASHEAAAKPGAPVRLPALEADPRVPEHDAIGLWGVDMSANEEYVNQRPHAQFFVQVAASLGIKIALPPESDLMQPPPLYGIHESHPRHVKIMARKADLDARLAAVRQGMQANRDAEQQILGALDALNYYVQTWMHDEMPTGTVFEELFGAPVVPPYQPQTMEVGRIPPQEAKADEATAAPQAGS